MRVSDRNATGLPWTAVRIQTVIRATVGPSSGSYRPCSSPVSSAGRTASARTRIGGTPKPLTSASISRCPADWTPARSSAASAAFSATRSAPPSTPAGSASVAMASLFR